MDMPSALLAPCEENPSVASGFPHTGQAMWLWNYFLNSWVSGDRRRYGAHVTAPLQWRHNGRNGVSNYQPYDCLLNSLFRPRSKKTSKLCVTALCAVKSPVNGEFPAQMANNTEDFSIWWRHHAIIESHRACEIIFPQFTIFSTVVCWIHLTLILNTLTWSSKWYFVNAFHIACAIFV